MAAKSGDCVAGIIEEAQPSVSCQLRFRLCFFKNCLSGQETFDSKNKKLKTQHNKQLSIDSKKNLEIFQFKKDPAQTESRLHPFESEGTKLCISEGLTL